MQEFLFNVGDWMAGWLGVRGKQRLSRFSAELKFQDRPSVAIFYLVDNMYYDFIIGN